MSASKGDLWMPRVRAVIPSLTEPFTTYDVCQALDVDPNSGGGRNSVHVALSTLADDRELDKETVKRGTTRTTSYFRRTVHFRASEVNHSAQRDAAEYLQGLSIHWGNARNDRNAAAD